MQYKIWKEMNLPYVCIHEMALCLSRENKAMQAATFGPTAGKAHN